MYKYWTDTTIASEQHHG